MKSCHQQCGESDQRLPQCLLPGHTCSTLWAISFCACWRAALAVLSCCTSLSLDSLSSVSSSSTLPSNCGNKKFVTCRTCLTTWAWGHTWTNLLRRMVPETRLLRDKNDNQTVGVSQARSYYSVLSSLQRKKDGCISRKLSVTEISFYI